MEEKAYHLQPTKRFDKALEKLPERVRERVLEAVEELRERPFLGKPLRGFPVRVRPDLKITPRSLRVGSYRVIYVVDSLTRTVYLITVRHRKHVYEEL